MISIIGLVTARGSSKGLPGKNIRPLGGKPLIVWTIEAALQSPSLDRVIVSTDSQEIAKISRQAGAEVPFLRPAELAGDDSPHVVVSEHAIRWLADHEGLRPDYVMLLQPTSPFRSAGDIEGAIELARATGAGAVVSVCEAKPHPCKTYRLADEGVLVPFAPSNLPYDRRQDLPKVYAENGAIYLNQREAFLRDRTFVPLSAIPYVMPAERSLDIDSAWDLLLAEALCRYRGELSRDPGAVPEGEPE